MTQLRFDMELVRELYEHSMSCKEHTPTFEQRVDMYGEDSIFTPQPDETKRCPASLNLVKDSGIYLMSPGIPALLNQTGNGYHKVCYAAGYDPDTNPNCWEASREAVGGDDFGMAIEMRFFEQCIKDPAASEFVITVDGEYFKFDHTTKSPDALNEKDLTIESLNALLAQGKDLNRITFKQGETLLNVLAGDPAKLDVLQWALDNGANIDLAENLTKSTPLHAAVACGNTEAVRLLIKKNANLDLHNQGLATPLMLAVSLSQEMDNNDIIASLIGAGADIERADRLGKTALHAAASVSNLAVMRSMLDRGVEVDLGINEGMTPLQEAVTHRQAEAVTYLLDKGADVNAKTDHGETPLFWALSFGLRDMVDLLIASGADASISNKAGLSMLHQAALSGSGEMIDKLLALGMDINIRDDRGRTPLHVALEKGIFGDKSSSAADRLIAAGADVNVTDSAGKTPLLTAMSAMKEFNNDMILKLMEAGADVILQNDLISREAHLLEAFRMYITKGIFHVPLFLDTRSVTNLEKAEVLEDAARKSLAACFNTPCSGAAKNRRLRLIKDVHMSGIRLSDVVDKDTGDTLFHAFCRGTASSEEIKELHGRSSAVNAKNKAGQTALMALLSRPKPSVKAVKALMDCSADIRLRNNDGLTARDMATQRGLTKIVDVLDNYTPPPPEIPAGPAHYH